MMCRSLFLILALLVGYPLAAMAAPAAISGALSGQVRWSGEVELSGPVLVPAGAALTLGAGALIRPKTSDAGIRVEGALEIQGEENAPVRFVAPPDWKGIELHGPQARGRIAHARFEGGAAALDVQGGSVAVDSSSFRGLGTAVRLFRQARAEVVGSRFEDNGIGIDGEMRSEARVRGCEFRNNRQAGILFAHNNGGEVVESQFEGNAQGVRFQRFFTGEVKNNRFISNGVGIHCDQTGSSPHIGSNQFENNTSGISNALFSSPVVRDNAFVANKVALSNDQQGRPEVTHNLFLRNATAVENRRRSAAVIEKNIFRQNRQALLCDYSSYPVVKANNFLGNAHWVRLGGRQTADFERRVGSAAEVGRKMRSLGGRAPQANPGPVAGATDFVDVTGNWWGEDTPKLAAAGPDANLPYFHDRHDQERVVFEEAGTESYLLDLVKYSPWLGKPVADAGPSGARNVQNSSKGKMAGAAHE